MINAYFQTNRGDYNFIQIDFGLEFKDIDRLVVVKDYSNSFRDVQVRIGKSGVSKYWHGNLSFWGRRNPVCAFYQSNPKQADTIKCTSPLSGRYLTMQNMHRKSYLKLDEVYVYKRKNGNALHVIATRRPTLTIS